MDLVINNKIIEAPIHIILESLKSELHNGLLKDIGRENNDNIAVTCPIHKNGRESHPSCNIFCSRTSSDVEYGKVHCFTCGYTATLPEFVALCMGGSEEFGRRWLVENFGGGYVDSSEYLQPIELDNHKVTKYMDESILKQYMYYHPYMWKRGLSKEVVDRFAIGYDKAHNSIVFPVWDDKGELVMLTSRSVNSKYFYIEENKEKPVYLLNYIKKHNIDTAYICESQLNALTLWTWGYSGVALFGTGTPQQYEILNKSGIRNYVLCFDGDAAGDKGRMRFLKNIRKDVLVSYKVLPRGKDVNDLTKEQFENLEEIFL